MSGQRTPKGVLHKGKFPGRRRTGGMAGVSETAVTLQYPGPTLTMSKQRTPAIFQHRFFIQSENQSLPLCFDIQQDVRLKLLHHPSEEVSVNGELDSYGGFKRIFINFETGQDIEKYIDVNTDLIIVKETRGRLQLEGNDFYSERSVSVIRRDKEINATLGSIRMVILVHEKNGKEFLWPALREKLSDSSAEGLLVVKPAVYEEVQQTPQAKLKIKDQEIDVIRSIATDYSNVSLSTLDCWLMSADYALQRPLTDFIVADL
ncbi:hypothetical protein PAMP_017419 [Pampus punctatissimus]